VGKRALERLEQRLAVVADDREAVRGRARLARHRGQRVAVRVADLAGRELGAGLGELVAGRDHHDPRPRVHEHAAEAHRGAHPDVGRAEPAARGEHDVACADVLAGEADVVAGLGDDPQPHPVADLVGQLDRHDRVGARRDRRAGHDPDGLAGRHLDLLGRAGGDLAGHAQLVALRDVQRAHCEPVHRGVREARHVRGRGHVLGQHAAVGLEQPELDRLERGDALEHLPPVELERDELVGVDVMLMPPRGRCRTLDAHERPHRLFTNSTRKSRNVGPRSVRAAASSTVARR
jgi:hypothetical protein